MTTISRDELDRRLTEAVRSRIRQLGVGDRLRTSTICAAPGVVRAAGSMATARNFRAEVGRHVARIKERLDGNVRRVVGEERDRGRGDQTWERIR
jgi:hypothetical protein